MQAQSMLCAARSVSCAAQELHHSSEAPADFSVVSLGNLVIEIQHRVSENETRMDRLESSIRKSRMAFLKFMPVCIVALPEETGKEFS